MAVNLFFMETRFPIPPEFFFKFSFRASLNASVFRDAYDLQKTKCRPVGGRGKWNL
ncbi:MAG: hypothetical protein Q4C96_06120 [Planctomycetia bacterium]|nr:hypothetical protein [Planctomycetia bacterium]